MNLVPINNNKRNPLFNYEIDPGRIWQINPTKNWRINPIKNWEINPQRNWQINPQRNWQINPQRNWQINPNKNYIIDPFRSNDITGSYVCSVGNNNCYYFTINTNNKDVVLIFNGNKEFCCFAVVALNIFSVFSSLDLSYLGYMCPNEKGGYNWFTKEGLWSWFLT